MRTRSGSAAFLALLASAALAAQQAPLKPTTAAEAPNRDTSYIDAQGTAHVTRVVPIPASLDLLREYQNIKWNTFPIRHSCNDSTNFLGVYDWKFRCRREINYT